MFFYLLTFLAILTKGIVTDQEINSGNQITTVLTNGISQSEAAQISVTSDSSKPHSSVNNDIPTNIEGLTDNDFVTEEKRPTIPPNYGITDNDFVTEEKRPTIPPNYGITDNDFVTEEKRPSVIMIPGPTDNDFVLEEKGPTSINIPVNDPGSANNESVTEESIKTTESKIPTSQILPNSSNISPEKIGPTTVVNPEAMKPTNSSMEIGPTTVVNPEGMKLTNSSMEIGPTTVVNPEAMKPTNSSMEIGPTTVVNPMEELHTTNQNNPIDPLITTQSIKMSDETESVKSNVSNVAIITTNLSNSSSEDLRTEGSNVGAVDRNTSASVAFSNSQLNHSTTVSVRNMSDNKPVPDNSNVPIEPTYPRNGFHGSSFVGGIVLCAGIVAIIFFTYKFCNTRRDEGYHQV